MRTIAVFGAGGGLGLALIEEYLKRNSNTQVLAVSRSACPPELAGNERVQWQQTELTEQKLQALTEHWQQQDIVLHGVLSTIGWLHQQHAEYGDWQPERRIEQLNEAQLMEYFRINAILPALILKAVKPLLPKKEASFVVQLGAKVGSISDNQLGGWYGYRASKAALNMLYKNAAIEFKRTHKQLCIGVIHPGTTDTELSKPFQERLPADKLYSAQLSAERICNVIDNLTPSDSGGFWFWDGESLPW
ncbi:MAG: SDR family NAD(P)-dependent oxidoreductase [Idiomarina sp.]|nr:SDR family NAD(P)-dependent oxidoreductase [Idiomarina sp.]